MSTDYYKDPENVLEIKESIKSAPTLGHLKSILDSVFPKWIIGLINEYSDDYPDLTKNWLEVCHKNNVKPTQIIMVDFISFEKNYSLLQIFAEILTLSGFCVRSKDQIFPCKVCKKAIPQLHLYNLLKENNEKNIPENWTVCCKDCF